MTDIRIRTATANDLPELLNLYDTLSLQVNSKKLGLESAEKIFSRIGKYPNYTIYVAESKGQVVGALSLLIMDNLAHDGTPSAVIEDLVVAFNYQRTGVGTKLMGLAMEKCSAEGCYKVSLSSNKARFAAHDFYMNMGFSQHGYSFTIELD